MPQHRFASIHVVGTNGKSSVTEITAALLDAHGVKAGAYLSPHTERWSERVRVNGREADPAVFAAAVERVAQSAAVVNRNLDEGDAVTQFEVVTAAAFIALASEGVEAAVIEAGLGGRLDATNVLPSRITVLTSVGLEHTEWLGSTELEIAAEKLAVLRDHTCLVLGRVSEPVAVEARATAARRHAALVIAPEAGPELRVGSPAPYQRRNFAVAAAAAHQLLGGLDPARTREVAERLELPGRMEVHEGDPPTVLDAAHNPDGMRALVEGLSVVRLGRPAVACLAVLADKDARGIIAELEPHVAALVCTELPADHLARLGRPGGRSLDASSLAATARGAGVGEVITEADPTTAAHRTLQDAAARNGVAVFAGSHYLLRYASASMAGSARPGA